MKLSWRYGHPMAPTYTKGQTIRLLKETWVAKWNSEGKMSYREFLIPADTLVIVWDLERPKPWDFINRPVYGPVVLWDGEPWCNFELRELEEGIDWVRVQL